MRGGKKGANNSMLANWHPVWVRRSFDLSFCVSQVSSAGLQVPVADVVRQAASHVDTAESYRAYRKRFFVA